LNILDKIFSIKQEMNGKNTRPRLTLFGIKIRLGKKKLKLNSKDRCEYIDYVCNQQLDMSNFKNETTFPVKKNANTPELVAFYLPQYHSIPENDKWFGKGFVEWFNVARAVPQFKGHYQPHLPIDMGYYNLDSLDVMNRQIELAKKYGVGGFCFYYYWFNGQKLLEKPIEKFLENKNLNIKFSLFWDSCNWTNTWNGGEGKETMYCQKIESNSAKRFMDDFLKYAKDSRYIKINNKPMLVVSSPCNFDKNLLQGFLAEIRSIAHKEGLNGLHIMTLKRNCTDELFEFLGFDSFLEFLPLGIDELIPMKAEKIVNKKFNGKCYDMEYFIKNKKYLYKPKYKTFKCAFPNWDNTARKCYKKAKIYQSNPENFKIWLKDIMNWTKEKHSSDEQFVFINAWNEWAEGAHLEPCQKYGYAYLNAVKEAIEELNEL